MKIITVANQKGGVGKSTVAMNMAYALQRQGYKVAMQDMDNQGTSLSLAKVPIYKKEETVPDKYDYLIVDTPPYLTADYINWFIQSDAVIMPVQASIPDVLALKKMVEIFKQAVIKAHSKGRKLKGGIFYNQVDNRNSMVEMVDDQIRELEMPLFKSMLLKRVCYNRTLFEEEGIFSENDKRAHREMMGLTEETLELIHYDKVRID